MSSGEEASKPPLTCNHVFSLLRYDQGREDGAVIDDWEDPKFEIYHTQDRYSYCQTKYDENENLCTFFILPN